MNKFDGPKDPKYKALSSTLKDMAQDSSKAMKKRAGEFTKRFRNIITTDGKKLLRVLSATLRPGG